MHCGFLKPDPSIAMYRQIRSEKQLLEHIQPSACKMTLAGHNLCCITYTWQSGREAHELLGSLWRVADAPESRMTGRLTKERGLKLNRGNRQSRVKAPDSFCHILERESNRSDYGNVKRFEVSARRPPNQDVPRPAEMDKPQWEAEMKTQYFAWCWGTNEDFLNGGEKLRGTDPHAQYCTLPAPADQLAELTQVTWNDDLKTQQHLKGHNMNIRDLGIEKSNYNEDRNDLENGKIVIPKETRVESEKFRKPISVWYNATSIQSSTSPVLLVHRRNGDGCIFPKDWEINGKIPAIIYVLPARNCNRWELLVQIQRKSY